MTAKKKFLLVKLLLLLLLTIIYGCAKEDIGTVGSDLLSKAEIIACLEEEGLQLQKTRAASPLKEKVAAKPAAFRVSDKGETLFIYVFDSFTDRKDAFPAIYTDIVSEDKGPYFIFTAKNASIIYEPGDDHSVILKTCSKIGETVFHGMHDINQVTFKGQGDYWAAEIKVLYYEYEWGEGEEQQQESYGREYFQAKYLGENPTEVTDFYFTYSFDEEESRTRTKGIYGSRLDENGTYTDFEAGSYFPREDDIINMTFEWDGKEEIIELKAITK